MKPRLTDVRRPISVALLAGVAIPTVAIGVIALGAGRDPSQLVALTVGVFAGFASALTFALALLATTIAQWPPVAAVVIRPPVMAWAGCSAVSIGCSFADSVAHKHWLVVASLAATAAAAAVGAFALIRVLSSVGGRERLLLNGRLLAEAVYELHGPRRTWMPRARARQIYHDFVPAAAIDAASNPPGLIGDFESLLAATDWFVDENAFHSRAEGEAVIRLLLNTQMLLPQTLEQGEVATQLAALVVHATRQVAVISGRLRGLNHGGEDRSIIWLAAQTRTLNWLALSIAAVAEMHPERESECRRIAGLMQDAQDHVRRCVDPDPPLQFIPLKHPWHRGLSDDPLGLLIWFASAFEFHGVLDNNSALYVAHESLIEHKNTADFNYGSVLKELEQIVSTRDELTRGLAEVGGFTAIMFDVLAGAIATCAPASWAITRSEHTGEGWVTDASRAIASRLAWIVPHGPAAAPTVDSVLELVIDEAGLPGTSRFESLRRGTISGLGCLQPPWSRVGETPVFHVAAGALMLGSWALDPEQDLRAYARRIDDAGRRSSLAALRTALDPDARLDALRVDSLRLAHRVTEQRFAATILKLLEGLR